MKRSTAASSIRKLTGSLIAACMFVVGCAGNVGEEAEQTAAAPLKTSFETALEKPLDTVGSFPTDSLFCWDAGSMKGQSGKPVVVIQGRVLTASGCGRGEPVAQMIIEVSKATQAAKKADQPSQSAAPASPVLAQVTFGMQDAVVSNLAQRLHVSADAVRKRAIQDAENAAQALVASDDAETAGIRTTADTDHNTFYAPYTALSIGALAILVASATPALLAPGLFAAAFSAPVLGWTILTGSTVALIGVVAGHMFGIDR